jgi:DNA-binding transcriptional LysR family regulator
MAARDYRLLAYFVEIVDAGSLREAARRLSLSPPVLSAALADLEATAGVKLLRRGRDCATPTEEGAALHATASAMVAAARAAMDGFRQRRSRPSGTVRVTLPTELSLAWLPDRLAAFERRHPQISIRIEASDEPVDLARSDFDLALRATPDSKAPPVTDAIARLPVVLVAAPSLVAGLPRDPVARLGRLPFVTLPVLRRSGGLVARRPDGTRLHADPPVRIEVNNGFVAKEFAKLGFGAALALELAVAEDLRRGRLVRAVPGLDFGHVAVRVLMRDRHPSAATAAFAAFLRGRPA